MVSEHFIEIRAMVTPSESYCLVLMHCSLSAWLNFEGMSLADGVCIVVTVYGIANLLCRNRVRPCKPSDYENGPQ